MPTKRAVVNMIALTLFLTVIISLTPVSGECPNGWIRFDKSCYRLFRQSPQSWPEAVFACEQHNAYLASIETQVENGYLHELIAESNVLKTDNVWIGLSDVREEGVFVWESTRQTATFLPWGKHEPNQPADLQEDCVMLFGRQEHTFADAACDIKYSYLCERPLNGDLPVVG